MSIRDRKARQKQLLRQEILDAARDILVAEGSESLTMRRVAEKIDYSPTAIYLHFRDKNDLVFCLCEETFTGLVRDLERLEEDKDPVARLKKGMRRYVDFGLKHPQQYLATFVVPHEGALDPVESKRYEREETMGMRALGILRSHIEACAKARKLRRVSIDLATRALWGAIHGVTSLLIVFPHFGWGDRDALIDLVIDAAVDGLRSAAR